jgi:hypothetical protein
MVRLVFRPYTHIWRSICTSESLRASTRVSSGFALCRHSSPSFGSQQMCSYSNLSLKIQIGRWCTLAGSHLRSLSLRIRVWHPNTRTYVRLLGPCFKTGRLKPFCQHPAKASLSPTRRIQVGYNTHKELHSHQRLRRAKLMLTDWIKSAPSMVNGWFWSSHTGFKRFPFSNFTYYWTLFSKFFSSFLHSTCSLSVSRQYLALDGVYHPIRAAVPNNPTLWRRIKRDMTDTYTGFSPSMTPYPKGHKVG